MSAPSDAVQASSWYDGASAVRRRPLLVADGESFRLVEQDRASGPFRFADLTGLGRHHGAHQYGMRGVAGWRLDLADPLPPALAARLPRAADYGGVIDRFGLLAAVVAFALIAAGGIWLLGRTPALAARLIPASVERRIGTAMVGDFGNRTCSTPAGDAALAALIARLGPAAKDADIRVVNVGIPNAVTLPGGNVLLFDGLIRAAKSPDEVAGVLGHELGHVANRDVLAALIRQLGLSVVLGGLDGNAGGWANALLSAGYSRGAESAADGYAIQALADARISPAPTAAFFDRLGAQEPRLGRADRLLGYLSSHPLSRERQARFANSARGRTADTPALDAAQWTALQRMCRDDKDVSKTEFRF